MFLKISLFKILISLIENFISRKKLFLFLASVSFDRLRGTKFPDDLKLVRIYRIRQVHPDFRDSADPDILQ